MSSLLSDRFPVSLTRAENLPSLPAVAVEVIRQTQDEDCPIDILAETISRDPALAARLLKLSNSSLFSSRQKVTTLERAAMVLGLKTVKLMSLSFSLVDTLPSSGSEAGFDFNLFWHRSLVTAVAARRLAATVEPRLDNEAFLCGLLSNLGRLVLARCVPDDYAPLIDEHGGWPTLQTEELYLGFHHGDLGGALLESWGFPPLLHRSISHKGDPHALPRDSDRDTRALADLMSLAGLIEVVLCASDKAGALTELHRRLKVEHDMTIEQVEELMVDLEAGVREAAEMLDLSVPTEMSVRDILDQARLQVVDMSLGAAVDLAEQERRTRELERENRELESRAQTDKLTGLPNRSAFDTFLEQHAHARLRGGVPRALGLAIFDVDHFKQFNDAHGHQVGDELLRMVGDVLRRLTRKDELCARYGGEEFVLVTPQTTPVGLKMAANRIREALEAEVLEVGGEPLSITVSCGCACVAVLDSPEDTGGLIQMADRCLYEAKRKGRNRCEVYPGLRLPRD